MTTVNRIVCDHEDKQTYHELIHENISVGSTLLYTDATNSYPGCHLTHGIICHSTGACTPDDDSDGKQEVH